MRDLRLAVFHEKKVEGFRNHVLDIATVLHRQHLQLHSNLGRWDTETGYSSEESLFLALADALERVALIVPADLDLAVLEKTSWVGV